MVIEKSMLVPLMLLIMVTIAAALLISRQIALGDDHAKQLAIEQRLVNENVAFRIKADEVIKSCRLQPSG